MCGIAGAVSLSGAVIPDLAERLRRMNALQAHRGPDGEGIWVSSDQRVGLGHTRLAVIDPQPEADQPMTGEGLALTFNGEIYNYKELRAKLSAEGYPFRTQSDTETILASYAKWQARAPEHLRGMLAFALWDDRRQTLLLARDRFGIKPLYYTIQGNIFYFASEIKALVPFLGSIDTDQDALAEYLTFQYLLGERTLFAGVSQLPPAHVYEIQPGHAQRIQRYWDVHYDIDYEHDEGYFIARTRSLLDDSLRMHIRSDVSLGAYLSGGLDSSLIAIKAGELLGPGVPAFHGRFVDAPGYDESEFARTAAESMAAKLRIQTITAADFERDFRRVVYHLDHPVAGPGSFPQFEVSRLASEDVKVVLGGQGGDEIFGGYARYLVAYLEQCLRASIDGTSRDGSFIVTLESMLPNLGVLREYQPLLQHFWATGLFGPLDARFLRLIDRSDHVKSLINWNELNTESLAQRYFTLFNSERNVRKEAYFDSMTHFEFKTLLPALLHVEDRMSMAHGLESRVPLLDHPLVEFVATVPADVKFKDGHLKRLLHQAFGDAIPSSITHRRDKMGFPVPLTEWLEGPLKRLGLGLMESLRDRQDPILSGDALDTVLAGSAQFSRSAWALMGLEVWMQEFHDRSSAWRWAS